MFTTKKAKQEEKKKKEQQMAKTRKLTKNPIPSTIHLPTHIETRFFSTPEKLSSF